MDLIEINIIDLQCCLDCLRGSTLKRPNIISLLVNGHILEILNVNPTESDLALNLSLRLFKSSAQC